MKKITKLINQRTPSDCALCATAMLLNKTYDEVWSLVPEKYITQLTIPGDGVDGGFELVMCDLFGIDGYWYDKFYTNRPAILVVKSLTRENGYHAIYHDGISIFDPQNGVTGKKFYEGDYIPVFKHVFQLAE